LRLLQEKRVKKATLLAHFGEKLTKNQSLSVFGAYTIPAESVQ
jgi:hypothetical protein